MKILVVIVTYNGEKWMERCIGSISQSLLEADTYVVDNNSTDGTVATIKRINPNAIVFEAGKNLGFGRANNIGMKYALDNGYDYVYLLNQDAWIQADTLTKMIDVQQRHPEYGILSPMQIEADESHFDTNFFSGPLSIKNNKYLVEDFFFDSLKEVYEVSDVMAAHWMISRDCLEDVGGFSPTFQQYGEDNNYIDRAHYFKYKVGIVPSARAIHDRAKREITKEKLFVMNCYTMPLVYLSDISGSSQRWKILGFAYLALKQYKSFGLVLKNWYKVFKSLPTIKQNKKESKNSGAFLK